MAETVKIVIDADDRASKSIQGVHGALDKLGGLAKGAVLGGVAIGATAIAGLGAALLDSVNAAMEAQEVQAQLDAVLRSTGGAAGVTAQMANDLASALQKTTRFEDDTVLGAENLLLTFTNIGKDVFPATVQAAADLSTAMGQDLNTSAMQLGKALNDPVAGMGALQRVGVTFSDQQKEVIKNLVETGDVAGAQKIILEELNKEFGGSAEAAGKTFAGQLDILKNSLGDVKEQVGNALLPVLSELATTYGPKVIEWAQALGDWLINVGIPAVRDFAAWWGQNVTPILREVWNWVVTNLIPALQQFGDWIGPKLQEAGRVAGEILGWLVENVLKPVGEWITETGVPALQKFAEWWKDYITPAIEVIWDWIQNKLLPALKDLADWLGPKIKTAVEGAGAVLKWLNENILQPVIEAFKTLFGWISDVISKFNEWREQNANAPTDPNAGAYGRGGTYTPPAPPPGGRGYSMPWGGGNPVTVNVNIAGNADPRTTRHAVLDALSLARARGMV
jgi:hypothetical protein